MPLAVELLDKITKGRSPSHEWGSMAEGQSHFLTTGG
jgi:hypothetical protein